jgi:large subunit ribosomal protein L10
MPRAEKEAKVKGLAERLSESQAAVLAGYRGLTVHEAAELRNALAEVGTRFSVVKNSLTRLAVKEAGLEGLDELIDGPTAIAFVSGDPVAGAKRLVEQARRFPVLEVRGGYAEGRILTAEDIRTLAALESREVMLARLAGVAKAQLARTAWALQALQSRFVGLMEALREKLPAEAEEPSASASEAQEPSSAEASGSQEPQADEPEEPSAPASEAEEPSSADASGSQEPSRAEEEQETSPEKPGETEGGT